ncbi:MAG: DUF1932 domain-containing protein [Proteobacteria bacterium]|nr:DUF1932 domain-containing protein [Pseudomonadota bacterium]
MPLPTIAILMPGDMGHSVGRALKSHGHDVITCLNGRSERSRKLAQAGGIHDVPDLETLVGEADMVLSILPPASAVSLATDVASAIGRTGKKPIYVDCNAVSPGTVKNVAEIITSVGAPMIDTGIIGLAPGKGKSTRFYVSGPDTAPMRALDGKGFEVIELGTEIGRASAMKMTFAAVTKGSWTLWTAILLSAHRLGLYDALIAEFAHSQETTLANMKDRVPFLPADAGRWVGEMQEIAKTFREAGVSGDFLDGAAWVFELLDQTPFASETRETMDRSRTLEDSIRVYAATLSQRAKG